MKTLAVKEEQFLTDAKGKRTVAELKELRQLTGDES